MRHTGYPKHDTPFTKRDFTLHAIVEQNENGTKCTLYPQGAEGVDLMSRWITAGEGSFVAVSELQ